MRPTDARRWLPRWIVVVTIGEAVGFVAPAAVGATLAQSPGSIPLLLTAGAVEGAVLGLAQSSVLRRLLPGMRGAVWVGLTAAAAVVAYVIGLVPSTFSGLWSAWAWPVQGLLFVVLATVLLCTIGGAQWIELRRLVHGAAWWIVGTAAAWLVGLIVFLAVATPLWHDGQSAAFGIAVGTGAGLLMAATMAVVTGITLAQILRRQPARDAAQRSA